MGYDAACTLTLDGKTFRGTASLEQDEILFRGDARLLIPLQGIQEVDARDGQLVVTFGGRHAVFDLGVNAERWATRISSPPSRLQKLGVRKGMRIAVIGVDDEQLVQEMTACGAIVIGSRASGLDMIFFGARSPGDLKRLAPLAARIKPSGGIWLIRAKGRGAPIREAESMEAGKRAGLVDVKVVSFSETHSAEKYVIPVAKREGAVRRHRPPVVPGHELPRRGGGTARAPRDLRQGEDGRGHEEGGPVAPIAPGLEGQQPRHRHEHKEAVGMGERHQAGEEPRAQQPAGPRLRLVLVERLPP